MEYSRQFNLSRFPRQRAADGTKEPPAEQPPELDPAIWAPMGEVKSDERFGVVWNLLSRERGHDFIWNIEALLRSGAERSTVVRWLRFAMTHTEVLDYPTAHGRIVMVAVLLLGCWSADDIELAAARAEPRFVDLAKLLTARASVAPVASQTVAMLLQARAAVESGLRQQAREFYLQAQDASRRSTDIDAPLLRYYAFKGYTEVVADGFSRQETQKLQDAFEMVRTQEQHPHVSQWKERTERYIAALDKARVRELEQQVSRGLHESTSHSFSSSGWHLHIILVDAIRRGAPLSLQRDLSRALLGSFSSFEDELRERLRVNHEKSGEWLARLLESGDIFRTVSRGLTVDLQKAGGEERNQGVGRVGDTVSARRHPYAAASRRSC